MASAAFSRARTVRKRSSWKEEAGRLRESPGPKPDPKAPSVEDRVIGLVAKQFKLDTKEVTREKALVADLKANAGALVRLRKALEQEFKIKIPGDAFKKLRTVGEVVTHIEKAVENRTAPRRRSPSRPGGSRWAASGPIVRRPVGSAECDRSGYPADRTWRALV